MTDFSNLLGKITRHITFVVPGELAPYYHESLKAQFSEMLVKGVALDIYDESDGRHYAFSFSSFDLDEVVEFSESVLGGKRNLYRSDSWLPLGRSQMNDQIELDSNFPDMAPSNSSEFTYKMSPLTLSINRPLPNGTASVSGNQVSFLVRDGYRIGFEYQGVNALKLLVELAVIAVVIVVAKLTNEKIKSRKKEK